MEKILRPRNLKFIHNLNPTLFRYFLSNRTKFQF